jgi:hypothetical protein
LKLLAIKGESDTAGLGRVVNSPGQGMWLLRATLRLDRRAG